MRDCERENVARPVDDDGTVTFDRKGRIALEPGTRGGRMTMRRVVHVRDRRLNGGYACSKLRSGVVVISTNDERGAQTMAEHALGIVGKQLLNLGSRIPAMRKQQLKRVLDPRPRILIGIRGRGLCCARSH